jgi:hypothetical protein
MILATYHYDCGTVLTVAKEDSGFSVRDQNGLIPFCMKINEGIRVDYCQVQDFCDDVPSYQELGLFYALDMTECGW